MEAPKEELARVEPKKKPEMKELDRGTAELGGANLRRRRDQEPKKRRMR